MKKINLLDCTLRDGGYINEWNFGNKAIKEISSRIASSGIEFIEVGFLQDIIYNPDCTIFSSNKDISKTFSKNKKCDYVGMIDMNKPIDLDKFGERCRDSIDSIRLIFKKKKASEAFLYAQKIIAKGYKIFIQFVETDAYSDSELIYQIKRFNELDIFALSIVDTFGLMKRDYFLHLVDLIDKKLKKGVLLGYHSHDNLKQARGNAQAMVEFKTDRSIIIDGSIFGMGRGAGNLDMELFCEYLNDNYGKKYNIKPLLEVIDEYIEPIYKKTAWGYSLPFYLSACNHCHPNYASFFAKKSNLPLKEFDSLLKTISLEDKQIYSPEKAEIYYQQYITKQKNKICSIESLKNILGNRKTKFVKAKVIHIAPVKDFFSSSWNIPMYCNY